MNLDPRKMNENIRGNVVLPHGTGKKYVVAAFVPHEMRAEAKAAGADILGDDALLKAIESGVKPTFQVCIATPDQMRKLILVGKQLGPLGLIPNPKMGTLTEDPIKAIREAKRGPVMVKLNEQRDIMATLGKVSFGEEKIFENLKFCICLTFMLDDRSLIQQLRDDLKPEGAKEQYFLKAFLKTTQSRSYQILIDDKEPWVNELKANLQS
ncbi:50S ribosomal protein L1 [Reticulomyxa filosa]|uniref:50S ribosomal protein L1 n=1 Tax=Reticulomyxa filosa TaxID=46433 RepID=X6N210_RETFI|nr:50S ribosomal protein L1 [Reticulomyxa filosa]|eukprot:ETO20126.1 50S ribosomal protein L1 [Reticulomyxa filosa]